MKQALIIAHPNGRSFTHAIARAYADVLAAQGHEVVRRDLYDLNFDPCLKADEIPGPEAFGPREDVQRERALLTDVRVFALFYPVWFNAPPAILKGYVDRVFSMGFGYGMGEGGNEPLLRGRGLISFSSSGAPKAWLEQTGAWDAMRKLFDEHVAGVCGLSVLDHLHFGGVVPNITAETVDACTSQVREAAARLFGHSEEQD